jgi:D-aminopeptidase
MSVEYVLTALLLTLVMVPVGVCLGVSSLSRNVQLIVVLFVTVSAFGSLSSLSFFSTAASRDGF